MATEKFELNDEDWTELGAAPCLVQSVTGNVEALNRFLPVAAPVAFVIAAAKPALGAPAHELTTSAPVSLAVAGTVWARAENAHGALVVVSR